MKFREINRQGSESRRSILPHFIAFLTVAVWGSTFVFTKLLLEGGLSAAHIFTIRFSIAYVLLLLFSLFRSIFHVGSGSRGASVRHRWFSSNIHDELLMLFLGVTGGSLYFLTENQALLHTTTTNTSLIVCSCPLVAAVLIGAFYRSERLDSRRMMGSFVAVLGVATIVLNGRFVLHLSPKGDLLALAANLCWAVYSLLMIPANRRYDAVFITRKVFFYGLLTMIPYYMLVPDVPPVEVFMRPDVLGNLLFLGCVASMICFLAWTWVMNRLGSVVATNYVYFNPITTVIFARLVLSEPITPFFLIGAALVLLGLYLTDRKR